MKKGDWYKIFLLVVFVVVWIWAAIGPKFPHDWLLENYPEVRTVGDDPVDRPGIVHRLDKDTSGVIIAARNQETFDYFAGD